MSTRKFKRPLRNPNRDVHAVWVKQLVWESALTPTEKIVAVVMAEHGDPYGHYIFPSLAAVAWWTSLSLRTVRRTVKALRDRGVLVVVAEADNLEHRPTEYRIDADKLPKNIERSKFLEEYRRLKRAEQERRAAARRGVAQGVTVSPRSGCHRVTPLRVTNGRSQGVTVSPEVKTEAPADFEPIKQTRRGDVGEVPNPQPTHDETDLRSKAYAWTEESPWAYRRFIRGVELAAEETPAREFDAAVTALARKHGVPPRFAHVLAIGEPTEDA